MKILFFNSQHFEEIHFNEALKSFKNLGLQITYSKETLSATTVVLATGHEAVISFVNDVLNRECIEGLKRIGTKAIFLRSAGFNHVDLKAATEFEMPVYRVPAYSPEAVAEHAMTLLMTLNRKTHKAYNRVREMNFSLEGLVGFNLNGKYVGVVGVGKIGKAFARIAAGFGCKVLLHDAYPDQDFLKSFASNVSIEFVNKQDLLKKSDVISFHCPLNEGTKYFLNQENIINLKKNVFLINTSRGAVIQTQALIDGLKTSHIGGAALDVYEFESELFFADHSADIIQDDVIARLITFPNVLITAHQGFLTDEALTEIANTTFLNVQDFLQFGPNSKSEKRIRL
ncbi:MAG: 2-hydroxyacid dehydrogenase [Pseudobdellovibrio sp.]